LFEPQFQLSSIMQLRVHAVDLRLRKGLVKLLNHDPEKIPIQFYFKMCS